MSPTPGSANTSAGGKRPSTLRGVIDQTFLRARQGELPVWRQMLEMAILKLFYGLGPGFYHTARFWRKALPWDFKTGFWPYSKFRRVVSTINSPHYQKMSQDKVCEKAILQLSGLPTPRFIGSLHAQRGVTPTGNSLTNAEELAFLLESVTGIDKVCFKLVEGFGGFGFQAVEIIRESVVRLRVLETGQIMSVTDFMSDVLEFKKGAAYIVEEYITQHPAMAKLNSSSVNTIRVWAGLVNGKTQAIAAFLRVGGQGSIVDNTSRGAHIFRLDLESGQIAEGMVKNIYNDTFECHRDSGERITGGNLPCWKETLELAQRAVAAFPHIHFAGVDVAITAAGPVVIELNVEPDPTSAIIFDRSHKDLLSIFS